MNSKNRINVINLEQYFKVMKVKLRFNALFFITGILNMLLWSYLLFSTDTIQDLSSVDIFAVLLLLNGCSETYFSLENKNNFESWGLLMQSGIFTIVIGILFLIMPYEQINIEILIFLYLFLGAFFNLVLSSTLKQYGMVDWSNYTKLNRAVLFLSFAGLFILINNFAVTDLLLIITSICFGYSRIKLALGFSELNTFNEKVSRSIYLKIDLVRKEYFQALEKNWDADRDLYS